MKEEAEESTEKLETMVGETIGFEPESVVDKHER